MQNYKLLYILGSGHCGSTLLDLLLNGHSEILALGEIDPIKRYIAIANRGRGDMFKSSGSPNATGRFKDWIETETHPLHTPLWQAVQQRYADVSGVPFEQLDLRHNSTWNSIRSWSANEVESWARPSELLLSCLHQISGARILTDASKSPHRLYLLQRSGRFDIKVIHLVRNGCAVVNSYIRKYGDFGVSLRRWATPAVLAFYRRRQFPKADWLQVRYEELVARPEETLKGVCAFVGVSFEHKMLAYRSKPYFGIGGNRLRDREDESIVLDEVWKEQLSYRHRIAFTLLAGWLNRLYGY